MEVNNRNFCFPFWLFSSDVHRSSYSSSRLFYIFLWHNCFSFVTYCASFILLACFSVLWFFQTLENCFLEFSIFETWEMTRWLRTFVCLFGEGHSQYLCDDLQPIITPGAGHPVLFWPLWVPDAHVCTDTHLGNIHKTKIRFFKKWLRLFVSLGKRKGGAASHFAMTLILKSEDRRWSAPSFIKYFIVFSYGLFPYKVTFPRLALYIFMSWFCLVLLLWYFWPCRLSWE